MDRNIPGKKIVLKIETEYDRGAYELKNIMIKGWSEEPSSAGAHGLTIYIGNKQKGYYLYEDLEYVSAHEAGHAYFGLPDLYMVEDGYKGYYVKDYTDSVCSVMNDEESGVQPVDFEMMFLSGIFGGPGASTETALTLILERERQKGEK